MQLALIGRYYERIGDHAVNIGERVQYMVTGWLPEHSGAARVQARASRARARRRGVEARSSPRPSSGDRRDGSAPTERARVRTHRATWRRTPERRTSTVDDQRPSW